MLSSTSYGNPLAGSLEKNDHIVQENSLIITSLL